MAIVENSWLGFVRRVREKLECYPLINSLYLTITDSIETVQVSKGRTYKIGDYIELDDEVMKVVSIDTTNASYDEITVRRAEKMTDAATHTTPCEVRNCGNLWTHTEIKKLINDAIIALRPEICYEAIDETLTTATLTREYTIPAAISEVSWVEWEYSTSIWKRERRARVRSNKLTFDYQPTVGKTIRLVGWKYQDVFSVSVTELTLGQVFWELIIQYATANALESTLTNRARFTEYSASLNPRASTSDEITRTIYYFKNQFRIKKELKAPRKGGYSYRPKK
jgi:hypothetical protein